jgi:hypothetical protein
VLVNKYLRKTAYKEERFILVHSFGVSIYDLLVLLVWTCGKTAHHGGSIGEAEPLTSWPKRNKERKRLEFHNPL